VLVLVIFGGQALAIGPQEAAATTPLDAMDAWEEAFDEASQTTYYFNRMCVGSCVGERSLFPHH
jgi:hypothetical protein